MQRGGVILEETVKEGLERTRRLEVVDEEESLYPSLAEVEKRATLRTLKYTRWNISAAAGILKISRPTLREKIRKYQLTH
jgi:transcriptional regulator of acetoin/glycerol metabolism